MIRKVQFESQERRIAQVLAALKENGINSIEEAKPTRFVRRQALILTRCVRTPSVSASRTLSGHTFVVLLSPSRRAWRLLLTLPRLSVSVCRASASPVLLLTTVRLVSATVTSLPVCSARRLSASPSWQVTSLSLLLRVPSRLPRWLTRFVRSPSALSWTVLARTLPKKPLRVILNGLGKDAAQIISRINGFTYVQTQFDYFTSELKVVKEVPYGNNPSRLKVKCYGADDVREGVAILWKENVDVSITGNSTNPTRFQHPVAGTYKKERTLAGKPYFSVASGYDRHHGSYALWRSVRRFFFCSCSRWDDGLPGYW